MDKLIMNDRQISLDERAEVKRQVAADLVDHLYQGCLPGTIVGIVASIALFLDFYGYAPFYLLVAWMVEYNVMMIALSSIYLAYIKYKNYLSISRWSAIYSIAMTLCAVSWVPCVYLLPSNTAREYLALMALFLATAGYATGTIGQFRLCVLTLNIMLIPLMLWCFNRGGIFYNIIGFYSILYMVFLIGINLRSTRWLKDSLKLKIENTLVSYQANHDTLTNLPNQRLLSQYIENAIALAKQSNQVVLVVSYSLNRMEMISDSFGYQAANAIIKSVADRLHMLVQKIHQRDNQINYQLTISRKDSFNLIIYPTAIEYADEKLKNFFSILDAPFYVDQHKVKVTASVGVSVYPRDGQDAQTLLTGSDAAMLKAKQFGGNRLEFYRSEINAQLPKQLELENDLHAAIEHHEFLVYYQPLIDLKSRKISGMEALIRWPHPMYGFISPMHFIPLAEETGLIVPIGEWVLREACKQTKRWHEMGYSNLRVAVNLSEKQIREKTIVDTVKSILVETNLSPAHLELEITETAMLDETVIATIKEFKKIGLSLAVDDFGTGYSGLSYLKRFAINKLKIDQSFIRDIPDNNDSITIVSAIIAMAKELNVITLAEGVETEAQLNFLIEKKCDYVQGYYYSKPLEAKFFTQLLENYNKQLA